MGRGKGVWFTYTAGVGEIVKIPTWMKHDVIMGYSDLRANWGDIFSV